MPTLSRLLLLVLPLTACQRGSLKTHSGPDARADGDGGGDAGIGDGGDDDGGADADGGTGDGGGSDGQDSGSATDGGGTDSGGSEDSGSGDGGTGDGGTGDGGTGDGGGSDGGSSDGGGGSDSGGSDGGGSDGGGSDGGGSDGGGSDGGGSDGGGSDGGGSDGGGSDGGGSDHGGGTDSGSSDGGSSDGGGSDGGGTDGGGSDGGGTDSGSSDGGSSDGGGSDSGSSDGGSSDDGGTDSGTTGEPATAGDRSLLVVTDYTRGDGASGDGAGQYRFIIMPMALYGSIDDVREANPDARLLVYQKVGGMRSDGGSYASTGVRVDEAEDAAGEDWFLHDEDGERLIYCDYTAVTAADIGNADYQALWLENVTARLERDGWDGVFMDDVNVFPGHCLGSLGTAIAEYPTDEDYGDAVVDFMEAVGPALAEDGFLVAPNVAMNPWEDWMLEDALEIAGSSTHVFREYWMRWDDSAVFTGSMWSSTLEFYEGVEDLDVGFMALTYGPGDEGVAWGQRYGRASFLMAWDGEQDSAWGYLDDEVDPWSDEWDGDIGLPTEERTEVGVGFQRAFTAGIVLLNPDDSDSQTFDLDERYRHPDDGTVASVTLDPGEAVIMPLAD